MNCYVVLLCVSDFFISVEVWFVCLYLFLCSLQDEEVFECWCVVDLDYVVVFVEVEYLYCNVVQLVDDLLLCVVVWVVWCDLVWCLLVWVQCIWWLVVGFVVVVLVVVGLIYLMCQDVLVECSYVIGIGLLWVLMLVDGIEVWFDVQLSLVMCFGVYQCEVIVCNGCVQFCVVYDSVCLFVVLVDGNVICDIGIMFQVSCCVEGVIVGLLEGCVLVSCDIVGQVWISELVLVQQLYIDMCGYVVVVVLLDLDQVCSWIYGEFLFDQCWFDDLLQLMNCYFIIQLCLGDFVLVLLWVSGSFYVGDQDVLVKVLVQGWKFWVECIVVNEFILLFVVGVC